MKARANKLRDMNNEQLDVLLRERKDDLMSFRMQLVTGTVDNVRASREARRDIARIKTILRERELSALKEAK